MPNVTETADPVHARDHEAAVMAVVNRLASFVWDRPLTPSWFEVGGGTLMYTLDEIVASPVPLVDAYMRPGRRYRHATKVLFPDGVIIHLPVRVLDEAEAVRLAREERATWDEWADVDARYEESRAFEAMENGCFF